MANEDKAGYVLADRPIKEPSEDQLGYDNFAKHLAGVIGNTARSEGFVIAIYAPWGAGKTTMMNLVRHHLSELDEGKRPLELPFNPWWFSGQELTRRFFRELISLAKLDTKWDTSRKLLADFTTLVAPLDEVVPYGQFVGTGRKIARGLLRQDETTEKAKKRLMEKLAEMDKSIVVFVDDIDRLEPEEVRELFQMIKTVGDLPNIVYLLAFDRGFVTSSLQAGHHLSGEDYLAKIIQAGFDLPLPETDSLLGLLERRLNTVLSDTPDEDFDQIHWRETYHEGLKNFFRTPRDIARLINALNVSYAAVKGEVNPVDFVAIEAIRLRYPHVYQAVRETPDHFAGSYVADYDKQEFISFHTEVLKVVPPSEQKSLKAVLSNLFPKVSVAWGYSQGSDESKWRARRRVCSREMLPIYFRLSVPSTVMTKAEAQSLAKLASNPPAFATEIKRLHHEFGPNGRRSRLFLKQMYDLASDMDSSRAFDLMSSLLAVGDQLRLERDDPEYFHTSFTREIQMLLHQLSFQLRGGARDERLPRVFQEAPSIGLVVNLVVDLGRDAGRFGGGERRRSTDYPSELLDKFTEIALTRLREAAVNNSLRDVPGLEGVLFRWKDLGGPEEPSAWAHAVASTNEGLSFLLDKFQGYIISSTGYQQTIRKRLNPEYLDHFLPREEIIERVRELAGTEDCAKLYLEAYDKAARGLNPDVEYPGETEEDSPS